MAFPIAAVIAAAATVASSAISAKAASDRQKKEFDRQKELQDKQYQLSQLDPVTEYYKQAYPGMKKDQAFVNPADMSGPNNTAAIGSMVGSLGSVAGSLGGSFGSGGGNQTFGSESTANTSLGDTQIEAPAYPYAYKKGGKVQIEAEGQELIEGDIRRMANENPGRIIPVSSRIGLITGPSHAGGGVPLNADNGSYIIPKKDANRYMEMSAKEKEGYKRTLPEGGSKKYQSGGPVFPGVPSYLDPQPYKFNPDDWYDPSHEQAPEGLYQGSNLNPVQSKMVPSTQYEPSASDYTVPTNRDTRASQRIPGQFQENVASRLGQAGSMAPLVSTLGQGVGLAGNIAAMAYKPRMPKYTPYQQSASYAGALRDVLNQKDMDPDIVANLKNAIARRALAMRQEGKYLTTSAGLAYNQAAANQLTQAENEFAMNRANYRNALRQQRVGAGQAMDTARATETADRNTIAAMNQQFRDQNAQRQVSNLQTIGSSLSNIGLSFEDRLRARKEWEAGQEMRRIYADQAANSAAYRAAMSMAANAQQTGK